MKTLQSKAFARAGLLGNPSDGYYGKTISFIVKNYFAMAEFRESPNIVFNSGANDGLTFDSIDEFTVALNSMGIYGAVRLLKSATLRFVNYCLANGFDNFRPFEVSVSSNIPRQVGMAGSSAIVVAMLKGLCRWNGYPIEPAILASLALASENDLGITAGLQDRVIQSHEGMVYMNFDQEIMRSFGPDLRAGDYEQIEGPDIGNNLYVAYAKEMPESTEVLHNDLKHRFEMGETTVRETLNDIANLATKGKIAIENGNLSELSKLIDLNFDFRQSICKLHPGHVKMVEIARTAGASAKYCGSGGAIVGLFPDESVYQRLSESLAAFDCFTFKPQIY